MNYYSSRHEATNLFDKTLRAETFSTRGVMIGVGIMLMPAILVALFVFNVFNTSDVFAFFSFFPIWAAMSYGFSWLFENGVRQFPKIKKVFNGGSQANAVTRRVVGAREPSRRELDEILFVLNQIVERMGAKVKGFDSIHILSNQGASAFSMGTALYVTSGLIKSKYLGALLAHEIGHLQEGDGSTMLALSMLTTTVKEFEQTPPLSTGARALDQGQPIDYLDIALRGTLRGGWQLGLASIALAEFQKVGKGVAQYANDWTEHFRKQDYKADYFSAQAGYRDELIDYLEELSLLEGAVEQDLGFQAPAELRLDRLLAIEAPAYQPPAEELAERFEPLIEPEPPLDLPPLIIEEGKSPIDFVDRVNETIETEVQRVEVIKEERRQVNQEVIPLQGQEKSAAEIAQEIMQRVLGEQSSTRRYKTPCANCLADIPEDYDSHRCEFCNSFLDEVEGYVALVASSATIPAENTSLSVTQTLPVVEPNLPVREPVRETRAVVTPVRETNRERPKDKVDSWFDEQEAQKRAHTANTTDNTPYYIGGGVALVALFGLIWMFNSGGGNERDIANEPSSPVVVAAVVETDTPVPTNTAVPTSTPTKTPRPTRTPTPTVTPLPTLIQNRVFGTANQFFVSPIVDADVQTREETHNGYLYHFVDEAWIDSIISEHLVDGANTHSMRSSDTHGGFIHPVYFSETTGQSGAVGIFLSEKIGGKTVFTSLFSVEDLVNACLGLVPTEYVDAVAEYPVEVFYYEDRLNIGFDQGQGYVFVCWADPNDSGKFSITFRFEHFWILGS